MTDQKTKTEITTGHLDAEDITIIFEHTYDITNGDTLNSRLLSTAIVGWYQGEPEDELTKQYADGNMLARYDIEEDK